ncbi:MAG: helix-turn-helix transcriptional regulator, partial [Clostridia bacterium]|nr:helix-turn-helix transcriptional regulator [Clostridia bacterium]
FGVSPYAYLLAVRLERARELLLETSLPVSEVAYRTGFGSDAHFIAFFRKETGLSPLKFRKIRY